jgi:hypothetical protein
MIFVYGLRGKSGLSRSWESINTKNIPNLLEVQEIPLTNIVIIGENSPKLQIRNP